MAQFGAMMGQMNNKKTKDGAKETNNMMQMLQNIDPIQKLMGVWDQGINAALPFKDIMEALDEVFGIWGDAVSEGFAPAMDTIITALTTPEVLEALREIGETFANLILQMLPLMDYLLPAMIWMIKAVANIIIGFLNTLVLFARIGSILANMVIDVQNWLADIFGWEKWARLEMMPFFDYIAAEGGNFLTNGPTSILAGEAGREHVQITPIGQTQTRRVTVNVYKETNTGDRMLLETIHQTVNNVMRENTLLR